MSLYTILEGKERQCYKTKDEISFKLTFTEPTTDIRLFAKSTDQLSYNLVSFISGGDADTYTVTLEGLDENTEYDYFFTATSNGITYTGEPGTFKTFGSLGDPLRVAIIGDTHFGQNYLNRNLAQIIRLGLENLNHMIQELIAWKPDLIIFVGDDIYTFFNTNNKKFPLDENGDTPSSPTAHYVTNQTDANWMARHFMKFFANIFRLAPTRLMRGNHDSPWDWLYEDNNGVGVKAANYTLVAINTYFGLPINGEHGWVGTQQYGYETINGLLFCYFDVCLANVHSDPDSVPFQPSNKNNGTLGQDQWNLFFNSIDGKLSTNFTEPFGFIVMHNKTATDSDHPTDNYNQGGSSYISEKVEGHETYDWNAGLGWTNPYGYSTDPTEYGFLGVQGALVRYGKGKLWVHQGHGHFGDHTEVENIPHTHHPKTTSSTSEGLTGAGFAVGLGDPATIPFTQFSRMSCLSKLELNYVSP